MRMAVIIGIAALLAQAGCRGGADYPALAPTEEVLAPPTLPDHARHAASEPIAETEAMTRRGQALTGNGAGGSGADAAALERRASALRARAKALSQRSLETCPEDQPDCPAPAAAPQ
jgi:hypothetical protein